MGALQETPDQDGLAHFLEHMCFNGTANFPGKGILDWLQSIGASFGGNVNASTGVEQTVYLLNNIPLVRPTVVDTCLLIMHDYSHFVLCDPEEIEKERGVILEEKRTRNDASWRMREKISPYLYGDTKYATTTIIGSEENLKTFQPSSLVNFYKTWYNPTNQALIVVGDIDVDEVEAKIASTFADIPAPVEPKQKDVIKIPVNEEPLVGVVTDPEANSSEVTVLFKSEPLPAQLNSTPAGLMAGILRSITTIAMNERFQEIVASPDAPFVAAGSHCSGLCETCDVFMTYAGFKDGGALTALEAVCTELEKLHRFGLSDDEVERAKSSILSGYENAANKADSRKNGDFVNPLIAHFFQNQSFMDPKARLEIVKMILPQLQAPVVNQFAQSLVTKENMVVVYEGPEQVAHPSEDELLAVVKKVQDAEIAANEATAVPDSFLNPAKLKGAKVKKTEPYKFGSELVTLSNGVKVVLLPTDYEKGRITIDLMREGGRTLIADADLPSFEDNVWGLFVQNTGVAGFSGTTVTKMLSGKTLSVTPYISDYTHGVNLSCAPKDIETAMQLLYLTYAQPRFDANEFDQGMKQIAAVLPNLEGMPDYALEKEVYSKLYKGNRHILISQEMLPKANVTTLERVYKQLFKDAAGATAIVVGDFDKETILPLICKYIGSLPKGRKATAWKDNGDGFIDGSLLDDFKVRMETPKVTVMQVYKKEMPYSVESEVAMDALSYILRMVYTETLREDEGGTYGASVSASAAAIPYERVVLQVSFETNCDQADRLRELACKGLKDIATDGPSADKFDMTVKNLRKVLPERRIRNAYWSSMISSWVRRGIDKDAEREAAIDALTPEKVKAAAAALLDDDCKVEFVMRPEAE